MTAYRQMVTHKKCVCLGVKSTWLITSELANQPAPKVLVPCVVCSFSLMEHTPSYCCS